MIIQRIYIHNQLSGHSLNINKKLNVQIYPKVYNLPTFQYPHY